MRMARPQGWVLLPVQMKRPACLSLPMSKVRTMTRLPFMADRRAQQAWNWSLLGGAAAGNQIEELRAKQADAGRRW